MAREMMKQILNDAEDVKPIARGKDGLPIFSFHDAQKLNRADLVDEKLTGNADMGQRAFTKDGAGYLHGNYKRSAIDPDVYFDNRYMVSDDKKQWYVVTDHRACNEQSTGKVYTNTLVAYVIGRKQGKGIEVKKTIVVTPDEFITKYLYKLDNSDAMLAFEAIKDYETRQAVVTEKASAFA